MMDSKYEKIKNAVERRGFELFSTPEDIEKTGNIDYLCAGGHIITSTYSYFRRGYNCKKCLKENQLEKYIDKLQEEGCMYISHYACESRKIRIIYMCGRNHENKIQADNLLNSWKGCPDCK